ncbi:hypothetical protein ALC57_01017 [Trachymyrmex cornetzi]|uniref:Uncharacterized protein n=1 Tax=Trachymyrmex cornetzi TaxID=471704 RepID=A0A151JRC8_9HYME|nr:hypothetical protein ALC57_01017 [Trachymyrmex cornetzi]
MISQGDLHIVETYMLLQHFFVSYDALLSLAKYIFNFNDSMSSHTASRVSMCMRFRSSSRSKFHNHVRFSCPLTYTIQDGSCQKFPWHGTRKSVMCENGPLFQHNHFLHDKFLVNDESLQIHERWHEHVVEKTVIDCGVS